MALLSSEMILDHLYLSALSRYPTEKEKQALLATLDAAEGSAGTAPGPADIAAQNRKREALEDILWSLLAGKEFLFNH